jgi:hypothetical protein|tara:strand:+ start:5701 stop:6186 length:486 start_codon:yes stop_codon:yes gene_type:complete
MATQLAPVPEYVVETAIVRNTISGRVTQAMRYWLLALADRVNTTPNRVAEGTASTQAASLSATAFSIASVLPGLYRLSMAARITRAATSSSSLIVTFGWTQAVACAFASAAMTGNTTATVGTATVLVRVDKDSSITYATTYASSGGTAMQYRLDVVCERVL